MSLKSNIVFKMAFNKAKLGTVTHAKVSFSDYRGNDRSYNVDVEDFETSGNFYIFTAENIKIADCRQLVTITIYN
ncbi:MAG: hypothetical protein IJ982_08490, partial [Fibrobacter sp.]|nr:hypothetical protein [Fibrobacter sp.]